MVPDGVQVVFDCFGFGFSLTQSYLNIRIGFPKKSLFLKSFEGIPKLCKQTSEFLTRVLC